jgi:hypothetical protein
MKKTLIIAFLLIAIPSLTFAQQAYVSQTAGCNMNVPCYALPSDAVNAVGSGTEIRITRENYNDVVRLDTVKTLTLSGGWNAEFSSQSGEAQIARLRVRDGLIIVESIRIGIGGL